MPPVDRDTIQTVMNEAAIPGVSIASVYKKEAPSTTVLEITDAKSPASEEITPETVFGAASLSKPVFAYLVLKLIEKNQSEQAKPSLGKFTMPESSGLTDFDLDTPLVKIISMKKLDMDGLILDESELPKAEKLTARMILSHMTGLPIGHNPQDGALKFQFEPNTGYGYSGIGFIYLQKVIEQLTGSNLETLAKENVFQKMPHSTFCADPSKPLETCAANSLHTTATDYAIFFQNWMNDPSPALQEAFIPQVILTSDKMKIGEKVPEDVLKHVAWGLGVGLQLDDQGKAISAYHSGDMNKWRAWVGINLEDKSAIVYLSNSHNGHILANQIIRPTIKLDHAANYFFKRYGFASNLAGLRSDWQTNPSWGLAKPKIEMTTHSPQADKQQEVTLEKITQYKDKIRETKKADPDYMAPTESSEAKKREKYSPFNTTPKPPWKY